MKNNKLLIVAGCLALLAALVLLQEHFRDGKRDPLVGKSLMNGVALTELDHIEIGAVKLVKKAGDRWAIESDGGFPADGAKISRMLDELQKTELQSVAGSGETALKEFGVESGTAVTLFAGERKILAVKLGESRPGGGQYLGLNDEQKVYLVSEAVSVGQDAKNWQLVFLAEVKPHRVKEIALESGRSRKEGVVLGREKPEDDLKVVGLKASEEEKESEVKGSANLMERFQFEERLDPSNAEAKTALEHGAPATVTTFDNIKYQLVVGESGKDANTKYFLKIGVNTADTTLTGPDLERVQEVAEIGQKWVFKIPTWSGKRLMKQRSDFVAKKKSSH